MWYYSNVAQEFRGGVMRQCGCEVDDNCTRTTVCALEKALQDQAAEIGDQLEAIFEALNRVLYDVERMR
jgi:hypothetical protein